MVTDRADAVNALIPPNRLGPERSNGDHSGGKRHPLEGQPPPLFLSVRPGMTVVVQSTAPVGQNDSKDWWMGQVIWCEGGARDPKVNTMFQIADIDTGVIRWVNADQVTHVLPTS